MKITAIETVRCAWYPRPVWVQVKTDEGIVGLGETTGGPGAVEEVIHSTFAEVLVGADPLDVEGLQSALMRRTRVWRTRDAAMRAVSAVDVALWDVAGQAKGEPVWRMLGGKARDSIRVYNTCASAAYAVRRTEGAGRLSQPVGEHTSPSPQPSPAGRGSGATRAQKGPTARAPVSFMQSVVPVHDDLQWFLTDAGGLAESLLADGFTAMKIWPFDQFADANGGHYISGEQVQQGLEPFRRIRDRVGDRMEVAAEVHGAWSLAAATRIVDALNEFDLMWVEDPVGAQDVEALAQIARISRNPVAASESLATRQAYVELFDRGLVRVCMLDVCWVGGLTEARAIASMAQSARVPLTPHDCTGPVNLMAGLHLAIHAPNALVQETVRSFNAEVYPRVVDRLPRIEGGVAYAPEAPGLGMALMREFLKDPQTTVRKTGR
jgi:L-alanine-DL-glutamate epimerase-like enolase superfamily enzyme